MTSIPVSLARRTDQQSDRGTLCSMRAHMKPNNTDVTIIDADLVPMAAFQDLQRGLGRFDIWSRFAMHDIRQRFRRSVLGPFWITLSLGIMVGALGLVFSTLFQQDMRQILPHIATGLIFWGLLTGCIGEGTTVFIGNDSYIRNVPLPLSVHVYRMLARNVIVWAFNMVIYFGILLVFGINPGWQVFWVFPGLLLFALNMSWMALAAGILSTRYRDIPQVIMNILQVVFFVTPVFWSVDSLPNRPAFVHFNPIYHMLEVVRSPLLGKETPLESWVFVLAMAIAGCGLTAYLYRRAYARIAYWV
jgi:ABC-type polysaccharide/polyol phosphate export permease